MKKLLTAFLLVLTSVPAYSIGIADRVEIERIRVDTRVDDNRAWVEFAADLTGSRPSCTSDNLNRLGISTDTDAGKAAFSMLLTALATGSTVLLRGKGECTHFGLVEDLDYGYIYAAGASPDQAAPDEVPVD